jgi:hypothetical protein
VGNILGKRLPGNQRRLEDVIHTDIEESGFGVRDDEN